MQVAAAEYTHAAFAKQAVEQLLRGHVGVEQLDVGNGRHQRAPLDPGVVLALRRDFHALGRVTGSEIGLGAR